MTNSEKQDFAMDWIDEHTDDLGFLPATLIAFAEDYMQKQDQVTYQQAMRYREQRNEYLKITKDLKDINERLRLQLKQFERVPGLSEQKNKVEELTKLIKWFDACFGTPDGYVKFPDLFKKMKELIQNE